MEMQAQKPPAKKRKLTEKNIPNAILHSPDFGVDSQMYQDLLNSERKLDWTIARKRTEVQDALQKQVPVSLTATRSERLLTAREDDADTSNIPQSLCFRAGVATRRGCDRWKCQYRDRGRHSRMAVQD